MEDKKTKLENLENEIESLEEKPVKEEEISIKKKDFDSIMERLAKLEDENKESEYVEEEQKNRTVIVRYIDDKIVIGYGKTYEKRDIDGRKYLMLQVITEDKKVHEVEYLDFYNQGKQEKAEIIKIEEDYITLENGYIDEIKHDFANYSSHTTGLKIKNKVQIPNHLYNIKLENGKTVKLKEEALN